MRLTTPSPSAFFVLSSSCRIRCHFGHEGNSKITLLEPRAISLPKITKITWLQSKASRKTTRNHQLWAVHSRFCSIFVHPFSTNQVMGTPSQMFSSFPNQGNQSPGTSRNWAPHPPRPISIAGFDLVLLRRVRGEGQARRRGRGQDRGALGGARRSGGETDGGFP